MTIERRLRRLESAHPGLALEWHHLIVEPHETKDDVVRRHFGEDGPPPNAGIIFRIIVDPPTQPTGGGYEGPETREADN